VILLKKEEYLELVNEVTPKERRLSNSINAFLVGGALGFFGEALKLFIINQYQVPVREAVNWVLVIFIFIASLFTALGFFDKIAGKFKAGVLVPITGFAHAITSAAMDYKSDGPIFGLGSNFFKLSGCVIIYGILAAFIMTIIRVILYA